MKTKYGREMLFFSRFGAEDARDSVFYAHSISLELLSLEIPKKDRSLRHGIM